MLALNHNSLWATAPEAAKTVLNVRCRYPLRQKRIRIFRVLNGGRSGSTSTPVHPDIICSITDVMPIATGSVDAVWSWHNLEHLQRRDVPLALREFFTVLKPRDLLLLELPRLRQVAQLAVENRLEDRAYNSSSGPITPLDMIFGHSASLARGNSFMAHRTGFTARHCKGYLSKPASPRSACVRAPHSICGLPPAGRRAERAPQ